MHVNALKSRYEGGTSQHLLLPNGIKVYIDGFDACI